MGTCSGGGENKSHPKTLNYIKMHGGKRENSGRKKKYCNPVKMSFNIEKEDRDYVKSKFGGKLNQMFIEWIKTL